MEKILKFDDKKIEDMANQSINLAKEKYDVKKVNKNILNIINN